MNKILSILIGMIGLSAYAQMYVSPSSYMYVNDTYVYVSQDVNLAKSGTDEGNIYLRNQSQLLQGTTGAGTNVGEGRLSVFQEGTTNNYQYNYWCSPVGVPNTTASNSNFGITLLNRPTTNDKISSTQSSITNGYDGSTTDSSLTISQRWIWKYVASNVYAPGGGGWQYVASNSTVEPGYGFTMKGVSGTDATVADPSEDANLSAAGIQAKANNTGSNQRYDFRGKPNDGTMSVAVSNVAGTTFDNMTLAGNPYPSAINLNYYLLENAGYTVASDGSVTPTINDNGTPADTTDDFVEPSGGTIDGNAYFWEHSKTNNTHLVAGYVGGYGTYAPTGSNIATPGTYTRATYKMSNGSGEVILNPNVGTGNYYERMFTPVGQGFMLKGAVPAGPTAVATMRNKYRVFVKDNNPTTNHSQFERNANSSYNSTITNSNNWEDIPNVAGIDYTQFSKLPVPQFKVLTIINDDIVYETAVAFNDITTDNFDYAFDAKSSNANDAKTTYFPMVNGGQKLVITTLPFDINKKIPVAFKCDVASSFKVNVSELLNFNLSNEIYLHDITNDVYYDILGGEFVAALPAGEIATQYEITFRMDTALSQETNEVLSSFQVFQNNPSSLLTIVNPLNKDIATVNVYDVAGKFVIGKQNLGSNQKIEIPTNDLSEGVYIVNLTTKDNFKVDKKVIVTK